jgi:hypothetical protein
MKLTLSKRKFAFLAAFVAVPAAVWTFEVGPTLEQRSAYIERMQMAGRVQVENGKLPAQRDEIRDAWRGFEPQASVALAELEDDLNPHLVQKRIYEIGDRLGCQLKIARLASRDDADFLRFTLTGEGGYGALVRFVDELEQGQHYVRFERLDLDLPGLAAKEGERTVTIAGVLLVPAMFGLGQEAAQ